MPVLVPESVLLSEEEEQVRFDEAGTDFAASDSTSDCPPFLSLFKMCSLKATRFALFIDRGHWVLFFFFNAALLAFDKAAFPFFERDPMAALCSEEYLYCVVVVAVVVTVVEAAAAGNSCLLLPEL